eukprot:1182388-Prorocentrum_minimum.AAC.2
MLRRVAQHAPSNNRAPNIMHRPAAAGNTVLLYQCKRANPLVLNALYWRARVFVFGGAPDCSSGWLSLTTCENTPGPLKPSSAGNPIISVTWQGSTVVQWCFKDSCGSATTPSSPCGLTSHSRWANRLRRAYASYSS